MDCHSWPAHRPWSPRDSMELILLSVTIAERIHFRWRLSVTGARHNAHVQLSIERHCLIYFLMQYAHLARSAVSCKQLHRTWFCLPEYGPTHQLEHTFHVGQHAMPGRVSTGRQIGQRVYATTETFQSNCRIKNICKSPKHSARRKLMRRWAPKPHHELQAREIDLMICKTQNIAFLCQRTNTHIPHDHCTK